MTTPMLLTTFPPTSDGDPLDTGCTKRDVVLLPFAGASPTSTTSSESESDASDVPMDSEIGEKPEKSLVACQWTGAPIRAIIPLPRRRLGVSANANANADANATPNVNVNVASNILESAPSSRGAVFAAVPSSMSRLKRCAHMWDSDADTDSELESGDEDEEKRDEGSDDCDERTSRYCTYQSITAAEGLSAWSFEELRVECYAQSLIARGTKPPPAVQAALAIPPAFIPRAVSQN